MTNHPSPPPDDERALAERARAGDAEAFARLVRPITVPLLVLLRRCGAAAFGGDCDEEDLLQVVLAKAWRLLPGFTFGGPGSFHRWLAAIARAAVLDRRKYRAARRRGPDIHVESVDSAGADGFFVPADVTSIPRAAARREEARRVETALARLPETQREVIERHLLLGDSLGEIAAALGIRKNAVWERLHRGLASVRESLGPRTATPA